MIAMTNHHMIGQSITTDPGYLAAVRAGRFADLTFQPRAALVASPAEAVPADVRQMAGDRVRGPVPATGLLDLIDVVPTGSDRVPYAYAAAINAAAGVAEAVTAAGPDAPDLGGELVPAVGGGHAAASDIALTPAVATVEGIRTFLEVSKKAVQDAPRFQALVDGALRRMLRYELERQICQGTGTPELVGILEHPGVQTTTDGATNVARAAAALQASAESGGGAPTGVLMSPATYFAYFLDDDAYRGGVPTIHKVPVVLSDGMPDSTVVAGNLAHITLFDRQQPSVTVSSDHADFYIRNLVAVQAEVRAALGVLFPASLVSFAVVA